MMRDLLNFNAETITMIFFFFKPEGGFFVVVVLGVGAFLCCFFFIFLSDSQKQNYIFNRSSVWAFLLENVHNLKTPTTQKARAAKIHFQKCSAAFTQTVVKKWLSFLDI